MQDFGLIKQLIYSMNIAAATPAISPTVEAAPPIFTAADFFVADGVFNALVCDLTTPPYTLVGLLTSTFFAFSL